jgi:hypothetical protein
MALVVL